MAEQEVTPEQIAEALRQLSVSDLLVANVTTLAQVAYAKLGEQDVTQARLAIDALRATVPVLSGAIPEQAHRDLQQVVSNLQLAFASVASHPAPEAPVREGGPGEGVSGEPGSSPAPDAAPEETPEEPRTDGEASG